MKARVVALIACLGLLLLLLGSPAVSSVALATHATPQAHVHHPCLAHDAGVYRITAYLWTGRRTATGVWPYYGEVAVDPRLIPLGSVVHFRGLGTFSAQDTGGAVIGYHIDVFVWTMAQAYVVQGNDYRYAWWCVAKRAA